MDWLFILFSLALCLLFFLFNLILIFMLPFFSYSNVVGLDKYPEHSKDDYAGERRMQQVRFFSLLFSCAIFFLGTKF